MTKDEIKALLPFATPRQRIVLKAVAAAGSYPAAAKSLGVTRQYVALHVHRCRERAALNNVAEPKPIGRQTTPGFLVKRRSTYYSKDGETSGWLIEEPEQKEKWEAIVAAVSDLVEPHIGIARPRPAPSIDQRDLLAAYVMGDPHIGMLSWGEETGTDFDLNIAQETMTRVAGRLVARAPATETALVYNAGDYFHTDREDNRTNRSHHHLDVDSRLPKMIKVGYQTMLEVVEMARQKHGKVIYKWSRGNHDEVLSFALAMMLHARYTNCPEVVIDTSPAKFHYEVFGANLLGFTHGDSVKKKGDLGKIMAADRRKDWGNARVCHWYTGHVHHDSSGEEPGCSWETLRTTAPGDAWHFASGYRAGRDMKCDLWHAAGGRVDRIIESAYQWEIVTPSTGID